MTDQRHETGTDAGADSATDTTATDTAATEGAGSGSSTGGSPADPSPSDMPPESTGAAMNGSARMTGTGAGQSEAPRSVIGAQDSSTINANLAGLAAGTVTLAS